MTKGDIEGLAAVVDRLDRRVANLGGNSASIQISGGGAVAVTIGVVAIVCLIAAVAIGWVVLERSRYLSERQDAMQIRVDTHDVMLTDLYRKEREQ